MVNIKKLSPENKEKIINYLTNSDTYKLIHIDSNKAKLYNYNYYYNYFGVYEIDFNQEIISNEFFIQDHEFTDFYRGIDYQDLEIDDLIEIYNNCYSGYCDLIEEYTFEQILNKLVIT